jgi:hypothetical protein
MKIRYEETCEVLCEDNDKNLTADILDFREEKMLVVSLEKSVKLTMIWNGQVYEGKLAGRSFVSNGPKGYTYKEGR